MKKPIIFLSLILFIFLNSACSQSSDDYFSFQENNQKESYQIDNQLAEADFFSNNLVIISDKENVGGDEELDVKASLLVNVSDQTVLYADHVYDRLYPASLTKLMTALIALKNAELTDTVTISYQASHISDPAAKICGFKEGDRITLEALLHCLLIYSGNDAGIAIAEHVSSSEEKFIEKMNEEAKQLGAVHTSFVNPHGLHDENHYTTAYDIYLIFNELLQYDSFRSIISMKSYTATYMDKDGNSKEKTFKNTNAFITQPEEKGIEGLTIIGGKTGNTSKAGSCLTLLCQDEDRREYIAVILKASNQEQLYDRMSHLLSYIN